MLQYFYNGTIRRTVIAFGTIFNNIELRDHDEAGNEVIREKVPLAYGPRDKFLARLEDLPNIDKQTQMTLPRMYFEMTSYSYDSTRKTSPIQVYKNTDDATGGVRKQYMPVPYNIGFELGILAKSQDDGLGILEQILPYFQPSYTLPIKLLGGLKEVVNVPVQLENVSMTDDYEGNFDTRRVLVYTLRFTAKTNLYGPISDVSNDVIKKVQVGYVSGNRTTGGQAYERDVTYRVVPRATKDYNGNILTEIAEDVDTTETVITVANGSSITVKEYITIGDEEMFVEKVNGNKITVKRGQDKTTATSHVLGSSIFGIEAADADFIDIGDNFGFDGSTF